MTAGLTALAMIGLSASGAPAGERYGVVAAGSDLEPRFAGRVDFAEDEIPLPVVRYREPIIGRGLLYNVPPLPFATETGAIVARY